MIAALLVEVPSSAHFIYIPITFIVGIVLGFVLGSRAARDAFLAEQRHQEERAAARAARAAAKEAEKPKGAE